MYVKEGGYHAGDECDDISPEFVSNAVRYNEPVHITGKEGAAVLMSASDYNDLMATMELCAVLGMQKKIVDGLNTSTEECLSADKVTW